MTKLESLYAISRRENTGICDHNKEINCGGYRPCYQCGWNPEVSARRAKKIRKKLKEKD